MYDLKSNCRGDCSIEFISMLGVVYSMLVVYL